MKNGNGYHNSLEHTVEAGKLPPHSPEAERGLLGGLLIDPDAYYEVAPYLKAEHFYETKNGRVYAAIADLHREGVPVDIITLSEVLTSRDVYPGGEAEFALADFMAMTPTSINARHYGRIIEATALRRKLIRAGGSIAILAWDESKTIQNVMENAQTAVFEVCEQWAGQGVVSIKDSLSDLYDVTLERREQGGQPVGLLTGLVDLDRILRGLKKSRFYVWAGRPGMGKSASVKSIALNVAKKGARVAIFNLEMASEEINQRLVAIESGLPLTKIEEGDLTDREWGLFTETLGRLSLLKIRIDDTPALTPSQLRAKCRRIYAEQGLDLVIVDYIQLMDGDGRHDNDTAKVSYVSRELKKLAKELKIPVIGISQLNRNLEHRSDKRPQLSDLKDSGSLEQDADVVIFVYRDEYYTKDESKVPNQAELIIEKHRNGPNGTALTFFEKMTTGFKNKARPGIEF